MTFFEILASNMEFAKQFGERLRESLARREFRSAERQLEMIRRLRARMEAESADEPVIVEGQP